MFSKGECDCEMQVYNNYAFLLPGFIKMDDSAECAPASERALLGHVADWKDGDADAAILASETVIAHCHMQLVAIRFIFITQDTGEERKKEQKEMGRRKLVRRSGTLQTKLLWKCKNLFQLYPSCPDFVISTHTGMS